MRREIALAAAAATATVETGDEKKRVRPPEAKKVDSSGDDEDADNDAAKSVGARLARKCATVCLTDTAAIETLVRAYTGDANRVGDDIAP